MFTESATKLGCVGTAVGNAMCLVDGAEADRYGEVLLKGKKTLKASSFASLIQSFREVGRVKLKRNWQLTRILPGEIRDLTRPSNAKLRLNWLLQFGHSTPLIVTLQDSEGGRTHVVSVGRIGEAMCAIYGEEQYALALSKESLAACCRRPGLVGLGEVRVLTIRESERRTGTGVAGPSHSKTKTKKPRHKSHEKKKKILNHLRRRRRSIMPVLRISNISDS